MASDKKTQKVLNECQEMYLEARIAFSNGRYDTAIKNCDNLIRMRPNIPEAYMLAGDSYFSLENPKKAEWYYKTAIKYNGTNGEFNFALGNCFYEQNQFSEALEQYTLALKKQCPNPIRKRIYYLLGVLNQAFLKNDSAALINFDKAQSISGEEELLPEILLSKIQIYIGKNLLEEAEKTALQLKNLNPEIFNHYQILYQIYIQEKRLDEAEKVLTEAEKTIPIQGADAVEVAFDRVTIDCLSAEIDPQNKSKHFISALNRLKRLKEKENLSEEDKCEVAVTSAEIFLKLDQVDGAIEIITPLSKRTEPELKVYAERSIFILLECYEMKRDYMKVSEFAERLKKSENTSYRYHGYYARAYAEKQLSLANLSNPAKVQELYNVAIAYFRNAVFGNSMDLIAYFYRAKAYADLGNYEKATEILKILPKETQDELTAYITEVKRGK